MKTIAFEDAITFVRGKYNELRDARGIVHQKSDEEEMFDFLYAVLKNIKDEPPHFTVYKDGGSWSCGGMATATPILEKLPGGGVRLSIEIPEMLASDLRNKFSLALVPAALDASDALVRATHALAGVALEMTHVVRKLGEKT